MKKMLNKLQTDILRRHIGPFIFCFFTVMFLLLMQFLILHIDKLVGKGLPLGVIIELILTNLAYMVVLAVPMAVLVASLMAFGKFSEFNEYTAMQAAGVNPVNILKPVITGGIILCIMMIWFSNNVLPDANHKARALFIDIRMKKPGFDLKANEFYEGIEGYTFLVKDLKSEADSLYDVTIFQEPNSRQNKAYIRAERGFLKSENDQQTLTLFLNDGSIQRYLRRRNSRNETLEETRFDRYRLSFDMSDLAFSRSNPEQHSRNDRTMTAQAMLAVIDSIKMEMDYEKEKVFNPKDRFYSGREEDSEVQSLPRAIDKVADNTKNNSPHRASDTYLSDYYMLNTLNILHDQRALHTRALRGLRSYKSDLDNLKVNLDWREGRIAQYLVEVHKKISIPVACIIFVLIGAPIGLLTRKGNLGFAALIGAVLLTCYWVSVIQGEKLADRLYISPFTGMWFANIVLGVLGIFMVVRITTAFRLEKLWRKRD